MRKLMSVVGVMLFSVAAASAGDSGNLNTKLFAAETFAYTASNVLDGYTTMRAMQIRGTYEQESAWLYGRTPTSTRYSLVSGSIQAGVSYLAFRMERNHNRLVRLGGHALVWQEIEAHAHGGIHNLFYLADHK
jgi:hypothetical protein